MTGTAGCRDIRHALGAYVLGAIDPGERGVVDEHLAACPDCREELAGLAGLPALLRRVPVVEAERLAAADTAPDLAGELPPGELLRSLLVRASRQRRLRRQRGLAAAAAVLVLAVGAGTGAAALTRHVTPAPRAAPPHSATLESWQTVSGVNPGTGAGLTVKYAATSWGTTMAVQVAGIPAGTVCDFQVTDSSGRTWVLGRWRVAYRDGTAWYPVSSSVPAGGLRDFQVTAGGRVVASVAVH